MNFRIIFETIDYCLNVFFLFLLRVSGGGACAFIVMVNQPLNVKLLCLEFSHLSHRSIADSNLTHQQYGHYQLNGQLHGH